MKKIRFGILGNAGIANKRFLPALQKSNSAEFIGLAVENHDSDFDNKLLKAADTVNKYGGKVFDSYEKLLASDIEAVYIPLPPALHFKWAKKALENEKNVYLEKPFTTSLQETTELVELARKKGLAVFENYAFLYHKEISILKELLRNNKLGDLQLIRASFGFPYRGSSDFRYYANKGGGALFDCGGYTIKAATEFMVDEVSVKFANLYNQSRHDVDMNGNLLLQDKNALTAQLAFGMDCAYKCDLELWGSDGYVKVDRFFTPPAEYESKINFFDSKSSTEIVVGTDDQFLNAICYFKTIMTDENERINEYAGILKQATLVDSIRRWNQYE